MTSRIDAVMRTRGPAWNDAAPMEAQVDWRAHADFMNALADHGVVLPGGPLAGTRDVLMVLQASDEAAIEARLAQDCWSAKGLLQTLWIRPWGLRLGSLGASAEPRASP